jgi:glycosyltransferase involved in cell wall biosynthesis
VIVSDGSTDGTDEIVIKYANKYRFIEFIRNENKLKPKYGIASRKVAAIQVGFKHLDGITYEYYGNLDADISCAEDFYSTLIEKFKNNPKLGLGGSFVYNTYENKIYPYFDNPRGVGGPIQFFRRQCWEDIGGYYPGAYEDSIAVVMARMKGWEVQSFSDIRAYHHKCAGLPGRGQVHAKFHVGRMEHMMGDHILYEVARCAGDISKKPIVIGSLLRLLGYSWSALKGNAIQTPADVVKYMRNDQLQRLKNILRLTSKKMK